MSPAQSGMILRKLEKLEAAYVDQAKRLKMLEVDNEILTQRVKGLGEENAKMTKSFERLAEAHDSLIRYVGRRG